MLSTLDIKNEIIKHFIISIFIAFLGFTYELFSHNVDSFYMKYAFLIPLLFGVIINITLLLLKIKIFKTSNMFYNEFIYTSVVGFLLKGALDIYGTTNKFLIVYLIISLTLLFISLLTNFLIKKK